MLDRELLEQAAKTIGAALIPYESSPFLDVEGQPYWNPLRKRDDALSLAVAIGIFDGPASYAKFYSWYSDALAHIDDQEEAFMRAVTCYAAEIGKTK